MARRSSSGIDKKTIIIIAVLFVGIVGFFVWKNSDGGTVAFTSSRAVKNTLPIQEYMLRGSALRDNNYTLSGKVENRDIMGDGEIITLAIEEIPGQVDRIPVVVPKESKSINIEREQQYNFEVRIENRGENKGLIIATKISNA